jgi:hypothetical protein
MKSGHPISIFKKLDDKPLLNRVTLDSRNTEDAAGEVRKKAAARGESPERIKEALALLRDKNRGDS